MNINLGVDLNQFDFLVNKSSPEKRHEFSLFLVDYVWFQQTPASTLTKSMEFLSRNG